MLKDLPLSEHIHQHCNESMERALLAERHPLWARSCPELKDIDFILLGLLRCISVVDSGVFQDSFRLNYLSRLR
ncbi:hypothetical protein [Bathymodiolus japonicus methanotrophic gill symbiont]|uniref:hypothetical protein n=1 Tax=Bathymodiolus japonicus methanotrophic gill symbiont TaxID=113269 RepID=UPI001C8EDA27|nr:hypothetical protein [Bathymodiolus japonicus methanotrophic gill symbiont]